MSKKKDKEKSVIKHNLTLQKQYNVVVIGAGPAGIMASIQAARKGASVLVMEQNEKPLKKLYATGNGRCNFSNLCMTGDVYRGSETDAINSVISKFDRERLVGFFEDLGMMTKDIDGYLYPYNEQARTVAAALLIEAKRLSVDIVCGERVVDVIIDADRLKDGENSKQPCFLIKTEAYDIAAESVIIAVGGKASPSHGSDGNFNDIVKKFGHTVTKQKPALVPLMFSDKSLEKLQGVRLKCAVSLTADGRVLTSEQGEIIFNKDNISGIPVMQMSRYATCIDDRRKRINVNIDLFPDETDESLTERLSVMFYNTKSLGKTETDDTKDTSTKSDDLRTAWDALSLCLNEKLAKVCLDRIGVNSDAPASETPGHKLAKLKVLLKCFSVEITGNAGFERAQVTAGGVPLTELTDNLESKLVPNLYIVGEMCDVDGTCGGYNLQWAFSSGAVAGMS